MKILLKFNSKSQGQGIPEAKNIAEQLGGRVENRFYHVEFDDAHNKDLAYLCELVGSLKGTALSIDGGEPIDARYFLRVLNCKQKLFCKGICNYILILYDPLSQFNEEYGPKIKDGVLETPHTGLIRHFTDFLEEKEEDHFRLNKEAYFEHLKNDMTLEQQFCDRFNLELLKKEIEKLPDMFHLVSGDDLMFDEETDLSPFFKAILSNAVLDSKMNINDLLECSRSINIILNMNKSGFRDIQGFSMGNYLEDQDFSISYNLNSDRFTLMKFKINEIEEEDGEDEEDDFGEMITKEGSFFCVKNRRYDFYFKTFDDEDPNIQAYFDEIKNKA